MCLLIPYETYMEGAGFCHAIHWPYALCGLREAYK